MFLTKLLNIKVIPLISTLYGVEPPVEDKPISNGIIAIIVVSIFAVIGVFTFVGRKLYRKFSKKKDNKINNESEKKE